MPWRRYSGVTAIKCSYGFVKYGLPYDKAGNLVVGLAEPNAFGMVLNRRFKLLRRPRRRIALCVNGGKGGASRQVRLGAGSRFGLLLGLLLRGQGNFVADVEQFGMRRVSSKIAAAAGKFKIVGGGRHIGLTVKRRFVGKGKGIADAAGRRFAFGRGNGGGFANRVIAQADVVLRIKPCVEHLRPYAHRWPPVRSLMAAAAKQRHRGRECRSWACQTVWPNLVQPPRRYAGR